MAYGTMWTLAVIGGCVASGALVGIVYVIVQEVRRG